MKERIKRATWQKSQCSNIFEMAYKVTSNKDSIYDRIHRHKCFYADQEWIRKTLGIEEALGQQPI